MALSPVGVPHAAPARPAAPAPAGHNGCLQCLAHVQRTKPQCPICRSPFSPGTALLVNTELRDLLQLATALTTTSLDGEGEWQAVTSARMGPGGGKVGRCAWPGLGLGGAAQWGRAGCRAGVGVNAATTWPRLAGSARPTHPHHTT